MKSSRRCELTGTITITATALFRQTFGRPHAVRRWLACLLGAVSGGLLLSAAVAQQPQVDPAPSNEEVKADFTTDVYPILQRNCLACHSESTAEAGVVLESAAHIRDGRDSSDEPLVVPGDAMASRLYQLASHQSDPVMPPEDNDVGAKPLDSAQLERLRLWIDGGALDGAGSTRRAISWQQLPGRVHPVYCVAVTPDGRWGVAGRGSEVQVFDLLRGASAGLLVDRAVASQLGQSPPSAAHLDLVQSVAVSPNGRLIASGGFRTVKIWERQDPIPQAWPALSDSPITAMAAGANGQVAVGRRDGTVQVYQPGESHVPSVQIVRPSDDHAISRLDFYEDQLLILPVDSSPQRWSESQGIAALPVDGPLTDLAWMAADQVVAIDGQERLRAWRIAEGGSFEPWTGALPELPLKRVVRLADNRVAACTADGQLLTIDVANGSVQQQIAVPADVTQISAGPNGDRVIVCSVNGDANRWMLDGELQPLAGDFRADEQLHEAQLQFQLAQRQRENAESDLKQLQAQREEETKSRDETAKQLEESKTELAKRTEALDGVRGQFAEAETRLKTTQDEIAKLGAQNEELQKQLAEAMAAVSAGQEAVERCTAAVEQSRIKQERTEQILTAAQELMEADPQRDLVTVVQLTAGELKSQFQRESDAADQQLQESQNALAQAQEKHAQLTAAQQELAAAVEAKNKEVESLKANLEEKRKEVENAEQQVLETTRAVELAQDALKRSGERVESIESRLPQLEAAVGQAEQAAKAAEVIQTERQQQVADLQYDVRQTAVLGDGSAVLVDHQGTIRLMGATDGRAIETLDVWDASPGPIALLPGQRLLVASGPTPFVLPLVPRWELTSVWGDPASEKPFVDRITALDFSPDGRYLAIGGGQPSRNGQLQIWDVAQGILLHGFDQPHSDTVLTVRFSPDGNYLASGAADRFLRVFDVRSYELAGTFEGHTHHVLSVDWQLDGRRLVTGSADQTVKLWDFLEKRQIRTIEGFGKDVTAVRFIAATEEFFAAGADQSVARCNSEGKRDVIARGDAYLYCLAAPAAGERLVTGSHTGAVEVLDAKGQTIARFPGQE